MPGGAPERKGWEGRVLPMEVTPVLEAGWGAKPADVLVRELALTAKVPVEALGTVMGGGPCEEAGGSTHIAVGESVLKVLGAAGKVKVAFAAAETVVVGCKGPPPPAFRGVPEIGFNRKGGGKAAAAVGAGQ